MYSKAFLSRTFSMSGCFTLYDDDDEVLLTTCDQKPSIAANHIYITPGRSGFSREGIVAEAAPTVIPVDGEL